MQTPLVANPFATRIPDDQPVTSRLHGMSSLPVSHIVSDLWYMVFKIVFLEIETQIFSELTWLATPKKETEREKKKGKRC